MTSKDKFSLALGGWGARGLAHIGVIKRMEELWVSPMAISGTSMGAVIGALFAIGKTSDDMENIIATISWLKLIDIDMSKWVLKWVKIEAFLDTIFEWKTFADTLIPISIIATNIDTGEQMIFTEWSLSKAVRASISLPWVFVPRKIDKHEYVDGGLTGNLPIEILPEWKVIAVSALRDIARTIRKKRKILSWEFTVGIFSSSYQIIQKTIDIMLYQNESRSILSRDDVLYIRPSFDALDYYEFDKYRDFIKTGYKSSETIEQFLICEK